LVRLGGVVVGTSDSIEGFWVKTYILSIRKVCLLCVTPSYSVIRTNAWQWFTFVFEYYA